MSSEASAFAPGLRIHDRFMLRRRIGAGGMSEVWRAEDEVLGRAVAVKVLTAPLAADPLLRAATWTEARAAARLTHPHVTQVYDYGEAALPGGATVAYLVMELVNGPSLAERLRRGPLPWPEAVTMAAQVAGALAAAHRIGIVHRDIKPGNVMLAPGGAKLLDFGIAALGGGEPATDGGRLVGTPAYAAPERLRPGAASPESDVYALGVVLYEALTGSRPLAVATWQEAVRAHRDGAPVPPLDVPGLPRQVRRLYLDCLSPDPAGRPTAEALSWSLGAAVGEDPPSGFAVGSAPLPTMIESGPLEPDEPPARRLPRPLVAGLALAVVVLAIALVVVTAMLLSNPSGQTAQPAARPPSDSPAAESAASSPPAPPPSPTVSRPVPDQIEAAIAEAVAAGRIDDDTAQELRDKLADLRRGNGRGKSRKAAQELQKSIDELRHDGRLDDATAARLTALLRPLLNSQD
ncbi:serine/threonine-protein kinase [Dactylosporangium sp. CA-092794]|uniref:serine/threonine-protein kinase n=1 Tax=Dactylosporangium sp. CA-092794 TaxID=3239929 RepID=UPI003D948EA6